MTNDPAKPDVTTVQRPGADGRRWLLRLVVQCGALLGTFVLGIVLVGVAQRVGWIRADGEGAPSPGAAAAGATEYTCPMHPEVRQDGPGRCPICGMKLVPATSAGALSAKPDVASGEGGRYICPMMCTPPQAEPGRCPVCNMKLVPAQSGPAGESRGLVIEPAARRILGIRTAEVKSEVAHRAIRTVGRIEYDQERVANIAAYVDGRLEELVAEYIGIQVNKGDPLAVLYSPQLYSAQVEYLTSLNLPALNTLGGGNQRLSEVSRDKLAELGMTDSQIEALRSSGKAQKRLRIASPMGGTVIEKFKVEGDYIQTGEPIYRVADLSTVWLMLNLYPSDAATVRFGQQVDAEVQSLPGHVFTGRVAFVSPVVDEKTRTVEVRVEMRNEEGRLKPGDYATASIHLPAIAQDVVYDPALADKWISPMHPQIVRDEPGQCPICGMELVPTSELGYASEPVSEQESIVVPRSAVLMAGDNSVVYVETEPGLFELRQVHVAALSDAQAVIREGLEVGEIVATDGNFLIDSQMQLVGKPSLMDPGRTKHTAHPPQEAPHAH